MVKEWYAVTMDQEKEMELKEVRKSTGMNRREFCDYFEIPYSTMTDWELGRRRAPRYLVKLIAYKVKAEALAKE